MEKNSNIESIELDSALQTAAKYAQVIRQLKYIAKSNLNDQDLGRAVRNYFRQKENDRTAN